MTTIPQHRFIQHTDWGVVVHHILPAHPHHLPVRYAHQDDYYIFGFLSRGEATAMIDFEEMHFTAGRLFVVLPGQVHRFVRASGVEGHLLLVESRFVGMEEKLALDRFSLFASSFPLGNICQRQLLQLVGLLDSRMEMRATPQAKAVVNSLVEAFVGIVVEAVGTLEVDTSRFGGRQVELVLAFRHLLSENQSPCSRPAYYAARLHVSTVYLNEVVHRVTGMSTTACIQAEVVLRAKRLLCYTDKTVKEIAHSLGISDSAYFSRLFTRVVDISPVAFRRKNLD